MDFFESMEKTIPAAANLAMKKLELDMEDQKLNILKQKWAQELDAHRRMNEFGSALKGSMDNMAKLKAQLAGADAGIVEAEKVLPQGLSAGNVEPGWMPTVVNPVRKDVIAQAIQGRDAIVPQLSAVQEKLSPESILMDYAAAMPEKAVPLITELAREKARAQSDFFRQLIADRRTEAAFNLQDLRGQQRLDQIAAMIAGKGAGRSGAGGTGSGGEKLLNASILKSIEPQVDRLFVAGIPELKKRYDKGLQTALQMGGKFDVPAAMDADQLAARQRIVEIASILLDKKIARTPAQAASMALDQYWKERGDSGRWYEQKGGASVNAKSPLSGGETKVGRFIIREK